MKVCEGGRREGGPGGGMEENILFTWGGEIILSTNDKCENNLQCKLLFSRRLKRIQRESFISSLKTGRKTYNVILKIHVITKSQESGNVCRLIVSKSALIKHVSRGQVF